MRRIANQILLESIGEQLTMDHALDDYCGDGAYADDDCVLGMKQELSLAVIAVDAIFTEMDDEKPADQLVLDPAHNTLARAVLKLAVARSQSDCDLFAEHCRGMLAEYDASGMPATQ